MVYEFDIAYICGTKREGEYVRVYMGVDGRGSFNGGERGAIDLPIVSELISFCSSLSVLHGQSGMGIEWVRLTEWKAREI